MSAPSACHDVRILRSECAPIVILGIKIRVSTHTHDNWARGTGLNQDTISSLDKIIGRLLKSAPHGREKGTLFDTGK